MISSISRMCFRLMTLCQKNKECHVHSRLTTNASFLHESLSFVKIYSHIQKTFLACTLPQKNTLKTISEIEKGIISKIELPSFSMCYIKSTKIVVI